MYNIGKWVVEIFENKPFVYFDGGRQKEKDRFGNVYEKIEGQKLTQFHSNHKELYG
jgi:hypothetical protein